MQLPSGSNPFTTLKSTELHRRNYVRSVVDQIQIEDLVKDYSYLDCSDSVNVVALNEDGQVVLVGQWRYPIQEYSWEIPAGMMEENEDPLEAAKRELEEEAGVQAEEWVQLGSVVRDASKLTGKTHTFLAKRLKLVTAHPEDYEKIESLWLPFEEILQKVRSGEIKEAGTVVALLKVQDHLQNLA
jgi:8-oxo-dGTP pyrophosphatase MutT (NUDIX family)